MDRAATTSTGKASGSSAREVESSRHSPDKKSFFLRQLAVAAGIGAQEFRFDHGLLLFFGGHRLLVCWSLGLRIGGQGCAGKNHRGEGESEQRARHVGVL